MIELSINGRAHRIDAPADTPLLWAIRDHAGLTGTKYGCGVGLCGACTVLVDGKAVRSCSLPLAQAAGREIRTIESVAEDRVGRAVQEAWRVLDVVQCGYCQSGQIVGAIALLRANPQPSDGDIDDAMKGNLCRCGTYQRIRAAIHDAARRLT